MKDQIIAVLAKNFSPFLKGDRLRVVSIRDNRVTLERIARTQYGHLIPCGPVSARIMLKRYENALWEDTIRKVKIESFSQGGNLFSLNAKTTPGTF